MMTSQILKSVDFTKTQKCTVIQGNFGQISITLPNQLTTVYNLLVDFIAIIMSATAKTNFSATNFV